MKILQLDMGREWRGGQRQVLYLMRHLQVTHGFETLLASPGNSPLGVRCGQLGLETVSLAGRFEVDPRNILKLRKLISSHGVDIVHTHCSRSASLGAMLKKACGVRLIHSRRVSYPVKGDLSKLKYRVANAVIAVSAEIGEVMASCGVPRENLHVIHSGIDPALYEQAAAAPKPVPTVIGVVGALSPQKGHAVFLKALGELAARRDDWSAMVVGNGELRPELEAATEALGLTGKVEFTGYRESSEALSRISILVVPSVDGEGSSGTIKEGWAAKVPVLCSDLVANLELVQIGRSGLTFANHDASGLARQLTVLMDDPELCERLSSGGLERLQGFTNTAMAEAVCKVYRTIG
ncbi:glycosyltransferase [Desulfovibrio ferrophilus]|uniref:Glycosyl transferase group 1 n=1 Tax=Desulfovibrio ferrophilus TaxID=241368 RepID=A0A2Z6AYN4_9BACT|nr:glycosyltransferase [Desulfovibrio ferrophilus]BBD08266.1 glycosyl transferase group 1 [Desulfovibrio ferrophilus]